VPDVVIVELIQCLAAVPMRDGNDMSLLKLEDETINSTLRPSRGRLVRGKSYRVTFEEIVCPVPSS
jgi:hypothetical protein